MKLYVGNLSYQTTEAELRTMFEPHGPVTSAKLATDRETGKARGFGFVEMGDEGARAAIAAMDGKEAGGRNLTVNEAKPREAGFGNNRR